MADAPSRTVLLLQGPRSPFFVHLAEALEARGARVLRVLFCPGDALFWRGRDALRWRRGEAGWRAEAARLIARHGVTDVVGLGDGRALHALAFDAAREAGALAHVVEQGWLRPGWLTLEPDALGRWRPDPARLDADATEPASPRFTTSFASFAAMDVGYHLANLALGRLTYPGYRGHGVEGPLEEWRGFALKALRRRWRRAERARALAALGAARGPAFLFALQLETDYQIRQRGPEGGLRAALARALADFAEHAPADALLLVKPHPLDPQRAPWRRILRDSPAADRALFLDGGALEPLFDRLAGLITVNSTAGLSALRAGLPVHALGEANYALEGLTDPGPLARFWTAPQPPNAARTRAFVAAIAAEIQAPGGFDGSGMRPGAAGTADLILRRRR